MHLVVVDPGLIGRGGHHVAINRFLVQEGKERGFSPIVLASKHFQAVFTDGFTCIPAFPFSPYTMQGSFMYVLRRYVLFNDETFRALYKGLPSARLRANSLLIVHTAFGCILHGLREYLIQINRPDIRVRIVLRFPPHGVQDGGDLADTMWLETLKMWKDVPGDICFYTDLPSLQTFFAPACPYPVLVTPIALDFSKAPPPRPMGKEKGLAFGCLGVPRQEKGIVLIIQAITEHLKKFPEDRFVLHTPNAESVIQQELDGLPPEVECVDTLLFEKDYFDFMNRLDVVLVPYHPKVYNLRTSHIFMEALGMGKAVVTTAGSWMDEQYKGFGVRCGAIMPTFDVEGLLTAMEEIHTHRDTIAEGSMSLAPKIRAEHCQETWFSYIMQGAI